MKVDAFLVLKPGSEKLTGETTDTSLSKAIEISSFQTGRDHGISDGVSHLNETARKRKYAPFIFELKKDVDAATPHLFDAYCVTYGGWVYPGTNWFESAEVSFRKAGGKADAYRAYSGTVYLKLVFEKVLLVSYALSNASAGVPSETVKFAFETVKMEYQAQTWKGQTRPPPEMKGWNFSYNKPI